MSEAWLQSLERELGAQALDAWSPGAQAPEVPRAAPGDEESWQAAMRVAAEADLRVVPVGRGSKSSWYRAPGRLDLALSTHRFAGVSSYEPGDGTVCARSGTTLSALAETVREGGHHLTPDVPLPAQSSLGGVIAAGQSGFDRLRYGPVRNALLGTRVLLGDGRIARSGGQLVKNVTGYDLHRLYCGSHGTLCIVLEASLRLHPLPEDHALLRSRAADRASALDAARGALALSARHLAVWCDDLDEGSWRVHVALCGRREAVDHEAGLVAAALEGCETLRGEAARAALDAARDATLDGGWPALELTARRSHLAPALDGLEAAAQERGLATRTLAHPGVAQAFVRLDGLDAEAHAALSEDLSALPARVAWRAAPVTTPPTEDPAGESAPALALMRDLRDALDPAGLFAVGRTQGGL